MDLTEATPLIVATAIAGILSPFVSAIVNRPSWSTSRRSMVATAVALAIGVVSVAITGGFYEAPWQVWGVQLLGVVGVSQSLYSIILGPSGALQGIERGTTPQSDR